MKQLTNHLVAPALRNYIAGYGIVRIPPGHNEPYFSPPLALSGFIIQTSDTSNGISCKINGNDFFTENAVATGQVTAPVYGVMGGGVKSLMVFFKPLGMYQLFGTTMFLLTNSSMTLHDFLGKNRAENLINQLKENQTCEHQIEVLNNFFLQITPAKKDTDKIKKVLDFIHEKKGHVTIADIENHGHYHRRTLERHFRKMIGITPRVYAQIYQFKCLINFLEVNPKITWTQLAEQSGYYDQSHMSRYIKEFLNVSPNSLVTLDMGFINYLLNK